MKEPHTLLLLIYLRDKGERQGKNKKVRDFLLILSLLLPTPKSPWQELKRGTWNSRQKSKRILVAGARKEEKGQSEYSQKTFI